MRIIFFILAFYISLMANDLQAIKKSGKIRVGVLDYSQFDNISQTNARFEKLERSLAKKIAQELLGSEQAADLVVINLKNRILDLVDNKIDLSISGLTVTKDKKEHIELSLPYFFGNTAILTKRGDPVSLINLKDKRLAIPQNSSATNSVEGFDFQRVECEQSKDCLKLLQDGQVDGYIDDDLTLIEYKMSDTRYEISIKKIGKSDFLAIGVSKGNTKLLDAVNEILIKLGKDGYLEALYNELIQPLNDNSLAKFRLNGVYEMYE